MQNFWTSLHRQSNRCGATLWAHFAAKAYRAEGIAGLIVFVLVVGGCSHVSDRRKAEFVAEYGDTLGRSPGAPCQTDCLEGMTCAWKLRGPHRCELVSGRCWTDSDCRKGERCTVNWIEVDCPGCVENECDCLRPEMTTGFCEKRPR